MTNILTATPELWRSVYNDDGDRPDLYFCYSGVLTVPYAAPRLFMDVEIYDTRVMTGGVYLQYVGRIPVPGQTFYQDDWYFIERDFYYQHHPNWGNNPLMQAVGIPLQKQQGGDWNIGDTFVMTFNWYSVSGQTCGLKSIKIY